MSRKEVKQAVVIIDAYHSCELRTEFNPTSYSKGKLHVQRKFLGIMSADFYATGQLLIIHSLTIM